MKPYDVRTTVTSPGESSKPSQPLRRTISEITAGAREGYHDEHGREHRADQPSHVRPRPLCARQQVSHRRRAQWPPRPVRMSRELSSAAIPLSDRMPAAGYPRSPAARRHESGVGDLAMAVVRIDELMGAGFSEGAVD